MIFTDLSELNVPCLKLEDTYSGQMYSITDSVPLSFYMSDTSWSPRFLLHVGKTYGFDNQATLCYGESNGQISIDLDSVTNQYYELSSTDTLISGYFTGDILTIDQLNFGTYNLNLTGLDNLCQTETFTVNISQPMPVSLTTNIIDEVYGGDGSIDVVINGGTPPYQYQWTNGDTTLNNSDLIPGQYTFDVVDAHGCSYTEVFTINNVLSTDEVTVDDNYKIIFDQDKSAVLIYGIDHTNFDLYNVNGQLIKSYEVVASDYEKQLIIPANLSRGLYFIKAKDIAFKFSY